MGLDQVREGITGGLTILGEPPLGGASQNRRAARQLTQWHFIGHLQRRKVRPVVGGFDLIHSVDSRELAEGIDLRALEAGLTKGVLFGRLWENYLDTLELRWSARVAHGRTLPQDAQKGCPARPQRVRGRGVPSGVR